MTATSATVSANIPTSLKLPSMLKLQLEEDAKQMGMSLHAFMVSTLANAVQRKRLRQAFAQDLADALIVMKAIGTGHAVDDVLLYFSQFKEHLQGQRAPPVPLQPKKWAEVCVRYFSAQRHFRICCG